MTKNDKKLLKIGGKIWAQISICVKKLIFCNSGTHDPDMFQKELKQKKQTSHFLSSSAVPTHSPSAVVSYPLCVDNFSGIMYRTQHAIDEQHLPRGEPPPQIDLPAPYRQGQTYGWLM